MLEVDTDVEKMKQERETGVQDGRIINERSWHVSKDVNQGAVWLFGESLPA